MTNSRKLISALLLATSAMSGTAFAQTADTAPQDMPTDGSEIIVTGTRATGMQAADSAAPIQLLGEAARARAVADWDREAILSAFESELNALGKT